MTSLTFAFRLLQHVNPRAPHHVDHQPAQAPARSGCWDRAVMRFAVITFLTKLILLSDSICNRKIGCFWLFSILGISALLGNRLLPPQHESISLGIRPSIGQGIARKQSSSLQNCSIGVSVSGPLPSFQCLAVLLHGRKHRRPNKARDADERHGVFPHCTPRVPGQTTGPQPALLLNPRHAEDSQQVKPPEAS